MIKAKLVLCIIKIFSQIRSGFRPLDPMASSLLGWIFLKIPLIGLKLNTVTQRVENKLISATGVSDSTLKNGLVDMEFETLEIIWRGEAIKLFY